MLSTLCHGGSTILEYMNVRQNPASGYLFGILNRGSFVVTNLIAELIVAISSKGHGEGVETDASVQKSMVAIAAELIAKQSPEMHEQMIQAVTRFLGDPKALGSKDNDIEKEVR